MGENGPVVWSRAAGEPVWMPFQLTRAASQRQSPSFFFFSPFCSLEEHISHCLWTLMSRGWKNKEEKNTGLAFRNVTRPVRTRTEKGSESCHPRPPPFFQTVKHSSVHVNMKSRFLFLSSRVSNLLTHSFSLPLLWRAISGRHFTRDVEELN